MGVELTESAENKGFNQLAERAGEVEPFHVMEIMRMAADLEAKGKHIIHLEMGEPSFDTPQPIVDAAKEAMDKGLTHYTRAVGIDPLRQKIAEFYQQQFDLDLDWNRVVLTSGASSGLLMALSCVLDPDDEILLTDPGYPCYPNYVKLLNACYRLIELEESKGFILDKEALETAWGDQTKALLLASPANPTGACVGLEELKAIAEYIDERKASLLLDEIYQGLNYSGEGKASTILQVNENALVTNSFSKYFGMTGWRIGWSILPEAYLQPFERLAQNLTISPNTISQYAALAAFDEQTLAIAEERRVEFQKRRDYLVRELRRLGFGIEVEPEGAFYIYVNIEAFSDDSRKFCMDLMEQAGVALTPGLDFSPSQHKRFVRISYTADMAQLEEAIARIEAFIGK